MKNLLTTLIISASALPVMAQDATVTLRSDEAKQIIPREIYGQFAEHLGTCIYGGLWVGKGSQIPNTDGYRTDVLNALKDLKVPVLRWPGGCFAAEYHWMDGIGPQSQRPKMQNNNWGGTIEDNSFGTHEFLNLCELIGAEPYISGNVGSGTVEEIAKWVEYMTSDGDTPMANLRRKNGREKSWNLKYIGVGNESWGCGGNMRPEYYSDLYRRYATYCRNYDGNVLYKVASGASDYDYNWTKVLMDRIGNQMHGVSLHYYTVKGWEGSKGSATDFDTDWWYNMVSKAVEVEEVIENHKAIMNAYDPEGKVDLLLDEWGTWFDVEPGTNPGHLYQQNTMRDAMVAAMSLNIFHRHTDRLKMANIAQIVNVLQAMILTKGNEMVLTPTYHVFRMYNVHQNAQYVPTECNAADMVAPSGRIMPEVSVTASKDADGKLHVSIANPVVDKAQTLVLSFDDLNPKNVTGEVLAAPTIQSYNDFGKEPAVAPKPFTAFKKNGKTLTVTVPAASVVALNF